MEPKFPLLLSCRYENCNKTLGTGGFASVILAEHRITSEKVAVKILEKISLKEDIKRAKTEIDIHKTLHHPNICQLYDVYEDEHYIILIMEYASGGELFDYIVSKKYLPESEARSIFRQILAALAYLHDCGYAHRDLKPENILIDENSNIKLIDFGLCANPTGGLNQLLATCCGSPAYAAPELLSGKPYYGNEIDIWSLGVLLYAILCGYLPFDHDDVSELYSLIMNGKYSIAKWVSKEARLLINKMIKVNPKHRATVTDLLKDKWVNYGYTRCLSSEIDYKRMIIDKSIIELISNYHKKDSAEVVNLIRTNSLCEISTHYYLVYRKCSRFKYMFPNVTASLSVGEVWSLKSNKDKLILKIAEKQPKMNLLPIPTKIICDTDYDKTSKTPTPFKIVDNFTTYRSPMNDLKKNCNSYDNLIAIKNYCITPKKLSEEKENYFLTPRTKNNIIEKMVEFFTPKHNQNSSIPRKVKALCNVATTSHKTANEVRLELTRVLKILVEDNELSSVENENFIFKCRVNTPKLIFELEICLLSQVENSIAIQRKRHKGDSWQYKKICERIFGLTYL